MGAKDWMVFYADGDVRSVLQSAPAIDRAATREFVSQLYAGRPLRELADGTLESHPNPPDNQVYAGCYPGLTIVCTTEAGLDYPSQLDARFLAAAGGRKVYLHAMHSVVDWSAVAVWAADGSLVRSLSASPDSGVIEDIGERLSFELPYWAGEHPVDDDDDSDDGGYPLPFHPLELGEAALRSLFGFVYEGVPLDDDPPLDEIVLAGFEVDSGGWRRILRRH